MTPSVHNRRFCGLGAGHHRLDPPGAVAWGGAGTGGAAGAGAAAAGFGFFGVTTFLRAALGGGPAGWSSATTGLGSKVINDKFRGSRITCTGIVTGWNLSSV